MRVNLLDIEIQNLGWTLTFLSYLDGRLLAHQTEYVVSYLPMFHEFIFSPLCRHQLTSYGTIAHLDTSRRLASRAAVHVWTSRCDFYCNADMPDIVSNVKLIILILWVRRRYYKRFLNSIWRNVSIFFKFCETFRSLTGFLLSHLAFVDHNSLIVSFSPACHGK